MKIIPTILLLVLITSSCNNREKSNVGMESQRKELITALDKFNNAFATSNLDILDAMVTENYLHTNGSSKVIGKTDWFNYLKKRDANLKSGTIEVLEYRLEDTKIEHHDNSAIVTGKVIVSTKDSLGIKENQYRITNLWIYDKGKWKRAGFHDGKIE